jgi:hypothetical protein
MGLDKYQPSQDEILMAGNKMGPEEEQASSGRAADIARLREKAEKLGFKLDTERLEYGTEGDGTFNLQGEINGHKVRFEKLESGEWKVVIDGYPVSAQAPADDEEGGLLVRRLCQKYAWPVMEELIQVAGRDEDEVARVKSLQGEKATKVAQSLLGL